MIRIVVDAMGSDEYPQSRMWKARCRLRGSMAWKSSWWGMKPRIKPVLAAQNPGTLPIRIVHAPEMLTMNDKGEDLAFKARHKEAKNSMAVGIDLVKHGEADAFVTAGNTGAGYGHRVVPPRSHPRRGASCAGSHLPHRHGYLRGAGYWRQSRLRTPASVSVWHHGQYLCRESARR